MCDPVVPFAKELSEVVKKCKIEAKCMHMQADKNVGHIQIDFTYTTKRAPKGLNYTVLKAMFHRKVQVVVMTKYYMSELAIKNY